MIHYVLQNNFLIFNRGGSLKQNESWTCRRVILGNFVPFDFIVGDACFNLNKAWRKYCIPIGNDRRCVHHNAFILGASLHITHNLSGKKIGVDTMT